MFKDFFRKKPTQAARRAYHFDANDLQPEENARWLNPERIKNRFLLIPQKNPAVGTESVVFLTTSFRSAEGMRNFLVRVRYIPSHYILPWKIFEAYTQAWQGTSFDVDVLAGCIKDDINSEIMPLWISVCVVLRLDSAAGDQKFAAFSEDRQRGYHSEILKRLALIDL